MTTPQNPPQPEYTFSSDAVPKELRSLIGMLIEGKITDLCFLARTTINNDGDTLLQGLWPGIDGSDSKPYTMVGALEGLKQDWLRLVTVEPGQ